MTWVLAKPYVQGYTLIIADICVTIDSSEGYKYSDCLLKIHEVHNGFGLQAAFSGNVKNAFSIIDSMRRHADKYAKLNPDKYLDALTLIKEWRAEVLKNKNFLFNSDREYVEIVLAGTSPLINPQPDVAGDSQVFVIKPPDYRPMSIHPHFWHHIGSGSGMELCKQIIDELSNDFRFKLMAIGADSQTVADKLVANLTEAMHQYHNEVGVSKILTVGITQVGNVELGIPFKETDESGNPIVPTLCMNYDSLNNHLNELGLSASQAKAKYTS